MKYYTPPGDKSITHRALILSALSNGTTEILNPCISKDTLATADCLRKLGVGIIEERGKIIVRGVGRYGLEPADEPLDCKNSATAMRLLSGVLCGQNFSSVLVGDASLMKRPMDRLAIPLRKMGANIELSGKTAPIKISPSKTHSVNLRLDIPSAQVLSAMQLLDSYNETESEFSHIEGIRNHTEIMIEFFNKELNNPDRTYEVSGDFSSAAFVLVWALLQKKDRIIIENVGINPTRIGLYRVLKSMGAGIEIKDKKIIQGESIGTISISPSKLFGFEISPKEIPSMIDEIPILTVAALFANGKTVIPELSELRFKETDRLKALWDTLINLGASVFIDEFSNTLTISGGHPLKSCVLNAMGDHRLAMSYFVLKKISGLDILIEGEETAAISYPNFYEDFENLL